jgi:hypothetical protein
MKLHQIIIRTNSSDHLFPLEMCCTYDNLAEMTGILDKSRQVIEYQILSGGYHYNNYTNNTIGSPCKKLVDKFDWNKRHL